MTKAKSIASKKSKTTYVKPYPGFPLFPVNATGRWCKKVRGKLKYFGKIEGDEKGEAALKRWEEQKDDLLAGRTPSPIKTTGGVILMDLCNLFLSVKERRRDSGEISPRTFADYRATTDRLIEVFGKNKIINDLTEDDFEMLRDQIAKTRGLVALGNEVQRVKTIFRFAFSRRLIKEPVRDHEFRKPSRKAIESTRKEKLFTAHEIRAMIDGAGVQLRAMIYLGINCGFGNSDIGNLPLRALDLDAGWCNFPRPKTMVKRRCPLWPETIEALRAAIKERPVPRGGTDTDLVFITSVGGSWAKETADNPVSKETTKLLNKLKIRRPGLAFYGLRHTFQTEGENLSKDQGAVQSLMGHSDDSMSARYRERIDESRLQSVTDAIHGWLFPRPWTA